MDQLTKDCTGVISNADDICIYGKNEVEHDANLCNFMEKARAYGLVLNPKKCVAKQSSISFFGMVYSCDGVKPDPEKTKEIKRLKIPSCVKELQSCLGTWYGSVSLLIHTKLEQQNSTSARNSEGWK